MTTSIPYQTTTLIEGTHAVVLHSITAIPQYEQQSFEELRLEDYLASGKVSNGVPRMTGSSGFGVTQPQGFGVTQPQGSGVTQPQGFGFTQPQGFGVTQPQGRDESIITSFRHDFR